MELGWAGIRATAALRSESLERFAEASVRIRARERLPHAIEGLETADAQVLREVARGPQ